MVETESFPDKLNWSFSDFGSFFIKFNKKKKVPIIYRTDTYCYMKFIINNDSKIEWFFFFFQDLGQTY